MNQSERRIGDGAEHVGESHGGPRNVGSKLLRVRGHIARRVNVDADALCLSGIELQVAGDKRAMLRGPVALKGVEKAAAFDGVFSRYRRGSRRFAGACFAVVHGAEGDAAVVDARDRVPQREDLVAARVGQHVATPAGEAVDAAELGHHLGARPQHQVVGVGQQHVDPGRLEVRARHGPHRSPRPDRHEARCPEPAAGRLHDPGSGGPVCRLERDQRRPKAGGTYEVGRPLVSKDRVITIVPLADQRRVTVLGEKPRTVPVIPTARPLA